MREHEFYPTPSWATEQLLNHYPTIQSASSVLEPCAGNHDLLNILKRHLPIHTRYETNDINKHCLSDYHLDASYRPVWDNFRPAEWTVTNPPFSLGIQILKNAFEHSSVGVALLLRLSFLEPTRDRRDFLDQYPPTKLIVLPRISFTGDGKTDSVTAAWMIWHYKNRVDSPFSRGIQIVRGV